jgi:hypothetical protein
VSGRHSKPAFHRAHAAELKTVGGVIAGAAIAGTIAASAAATTPNTTSTTATHLASQRALADVAVLRADDRPTSPHEAHSKHQAHAKHKTPPGAHPDEAEKSRSSRAESAKSSKSSRSSERRPARARSVSAQKVLDLARDQVGISEDRSGATKFNKWYMADSRAQRTLKRDGGSRAAYRDAAWCDMFVSWIGDKLGVSGTVGFDAWAVKHAEWFKDHDRWGHEPRPGAVTFFGWNGHKINDIEHVGFTIKDNHDGTIKTVEGNTHNTVAIRTRKKSFVVGYGYPDYKK